MDNICIWLIYPLANVLPVCEHFHMAMYSSLIYPSTTRWFSKVMWVYQSRYLKFENVHLGELIIGVATFFRWFELLILAVNTLRVWDSLDFSYSFLVLLPFAARDPAKVCMFTEILQVSWLMAGWWFGTCFTFPSIGNLIIPIDEL